MTRHPILVSTVWLSLIVDPGAASAQVPEMQAVGRYLDWTVRVHDPAQLNPLHQVASLTFTDRMTVADAVRTALAGTGYRLEPPDEVYTQALLTSRVAVAHLHFEARRLDSVVAAILGDGRGVTVRVNHLHRALRVQSQGGGS